MAKRIIKQIFIDHWDEFTKKYSNIREVVLHEVNKMMQCGSLKNGFLEFKCDTCGEVKKGDLLVKAGCVHHAVKFVWMIGVKTLLKERQEQTVGTLYPPYQKKLE